MDSDFWHIWFDKSWFKKDGESDFLFMDSGCQFPEYQHFLHSWKEPERLRSQMFFPTTALLSIFGKKKTEAVTNFISAKIFPAACFTSCGYTSKTNLLPVRHSSLFSLITKLPFCTCLSSLPRFAIFWTYTFHIIPDKIIVDRRGCRSSSFAALPPETWKTHRWWMNNGL